MLKASLERLLPFNDPSFSLCISGCLRHVQYAFEVGKVDEASCEEVPYRIYVCKLLSRLSLDVASVCKSGAFAIHMFILSCV